MNSYLENNAFLNNNMSWSLIVEETFVSGLIASKTCIPILPDIWINDSISSIIQF